MSCFQIIGGGASPASPPESATVTNLVRYKYTVHPMINLYENSKLFMIYIKKGNWAYVIALKPFNMLKD